MPDIPMCGNCENIGEHAYGLLEEEKECLKTKERSEAFQKAAVKRGLDPVDRFRFNPTRGVLPYSEAHRCNFYSRKKSQQGDK